MKKALIPGFEVQYLFERGKENFLYRRRIPSRYRALANGRLEFKASLKCIDKDEIIQKYGQLHAHFESLFALLKAGKSLSSKDIQPIKFLKDRAAQLGVTYKTAKDLMAEGNMHSFLSRVILAEKQGLDDFTNIQTLFGAADDTTTIQDVLEFYEEHTRDQLNGLNPREISKKLSPIRLAVKKANVFFGADKSLLDLTKKDVLSYRSYWVDLVQDGELKASTANKQIMHLRKIITFYIDLNGLQHTNPFSSIHLKEDNKARPAYSVEFLKKTWLQGSPFETLDTEALHILYAIMDTGAGPKEICGLAPEDIYIDQDVPYIEIRANQFRKMKTNHRGRKIPLVGQSLKALKLYPTGFPNYRTPNGPDNLSANVNKYLKNHGLTESDKHGIYSLRHTFKDRMRAHDFPSELQNYLMGHKDASMGAHYGSGYQPAQIHSFMKKMEADWTK